MVKVGGILIFVQPPGLSRVLNRCWKERPCSQRQIAVTIGIDTRDISIHPIAVGRDFLDASTIRDWISSLTPRSLPLLAGTAHSHIHPNPNWHHHEQPATTASDGTTEGTGRSSGDFMAPYYT